MVFSFQKTMENLRLYMQVSSKAQGDFVVTMDADLQDSPEEILIYDRSNKRRRSRPDFWMEEKTLRLHSFEKFTLQTL